MSYFLTHDHVVGAVHFREMVIRFGSKPRGYIWTLLDPTARILLMTGILRAIARARALSICSALFFATGYLVFQFYQAMSSYMNSSVRPNKTLLNYPNAAPIDAVVARFVLQACTISLVAFIVLGTIIVVTLSREPSIHWPSLPEAATLACIFGLGVAMGNCFLLLKYQVYEQVGFRKGFYPEYRANGLDMNYLYVVAFLTLFVEMLVFTLSRRTLRNK
ncbi:ABC transporter permease [Ensifer sp. NPDC090286]|uniref:ABC transporter permease n=1 Tax=Ensifer sp. NPDC090286 TaxID=3363991 RepID=UPI00383B0829